MNTYQPTHLDGRTIVILSDQSIGYRILESGQLSYDGNTLSLMTDESERPFLDHEAEALLLVNPENRIPQCQGFDLFLIVEP